jgi:hypothetical protein
MEAENRLFDIETLPYTVRFGLGSTEPMKRWARFEISKSGDLYLTRGIDVRKDVDSSNIHTTIHKSGKIFSSRYSGKGEQKRKYYSCEVGEIGGPFKDVTHPHQVVSGNELFEPGYLYYGLPTLTDKDKKTDTQNRFVACLDALLVNSRLYSSIAVVPWINEEEITAYLMTKQGQVFIENDPRCHVFIFCWEHVSIAVTMRFIDGNSPLDIQKVAEADKNAHPLKRLFHHEELALSESTSLNIAKKEKS